MPLLQSFEFLRRDKEPHYIWYTARYGWHAGMHKGAILAYTIGLGPMHHEVQHYRHYRSNTDYGDDDAVVISIALSFASEADEVDCIAAHGVRVFPDKALRTRSRARTWSPV